MKTRNLVTHSWAVVWILVMTVLVVSAQTAWSDWLTPRDGDPNLEYRWRRDGMCLAAGCAKAVEFRNLGKTTLRFDYTLWAKDMRDPATEVKDTGTTSVGSENTTTVSSTTGGDLVRVVVRMR